MQLWNADGIDERNAHTGDELDMFREIDDDFDIDIHDEIDSELMNEDDDNINDFYD